MASLRSRLVPTDIVTWNRLGRCTFVARLLFLGMWTRADDEGRILADPAQLRASIFPHDVEEIVLEQIETWCRELHLQRLVQFYEFDHDRYAQVLDFPKFQHLKRAVESEIPPATGQLGLGLMHRCDNCAGWAKNWELCPAAFPVDTYIRARARVEEKKKGREEKGTATQSHVARPARDVVWDPSTQPFCALFTQLLAGNGCKTGPITQGWLRDADRMFRLDKRDPREAEEVLAWTMSDEFEKAVVLSVPKFRSRYDSLRMKAKRPRVVHGRNGHLHGGEVGMSMLAEAAHLRSQQTPSRSAE